VFAVVNRVTCRSLDEALKKDPSMHGNLRIREAIPKAAPLWYSHALFPLTPALSLREREHHRQRIRQPEPHRQRIRQPEPLAVVATRSLVLALHEPATRYAGKGLLSPALSSRGGEGEGRRFAIRGFKARNSL